MSIEKTETVFRSFVRGDGKARTSPLINYSGSHLYQRSSGVRRAVRTNTNTTLGTISECIAVRLSEFTIIHPELSKSQVLPLLREYGATEMFDEDFDTVKNLLEMRNLEAHFPHMRKTLSPKEIKVYRNAAGQIISAKKAMTLKRRGECNIAPEIAVAREPMGIAEQLKHILDQYNIESPFGSDSYDLMRYFNRAYLKSQYSIALCDLGLQDHTIDLVTKPLRINHRWTFVEDKQDAMLLMVAVPFSEKVYLTDW